MWQKHGLIFSVQGQSDLCTSHAAIPFALERTDGTHRVFFAARDAASRSRTFTLDLDLRGATPQVTFDPAPALGIGELGAFDDSGAMPSWVERHDGKLLLYYTGWSLGKSVPFYFYIGLAESRDEGRTFTRVSRAPVLGRNRLNPLLTASPCILREKGLWRMWYINGVRWEQRPDELRHYYNVHYAESKNGVTWEPAERAAVDFQGAEEYAFGRPSVVKTDDGYLMWYAVRGAQYRLGLAWSKDGYRWTRADDQVGIAPGPEAWDSEMIAYAHVFKAGSRWYMLYNGNGYGKTGIGLASCAALPRFR